MKNILATIIIALGTGVAGSFSGWFFGRKKQRIAEIDAAVETWQKIVNSLETQIVKLLNQRACDSKKIDDLGKQIKDLQSEVEVLQTKLKRVDRLEKTIARYEKILCDNNIEH